MDLLTRRTKKVGFGIGLLLVGLVLVWNGFASLTVSGNDGRYELTESLAMEASSRAVVTNDVELLRGHYRCYSDLAPIYWFYSTPDDVRVRGVATESSTMRSPSNGTASASLPKSRMRMWRTPGATAPPILRLR